MTGRAAGIVSGLLALAALYALQVSRILTTRDGPWAWVELVALTAFALALFPCIVVCQRVISSQRWKRALANSPSPRHELTMIGDVYDDARGVVKVGVWVAPGEVVLAALSGAAGDPSTVRRTALSDIADVRTRIADTSWDWATELEVELDDGSAWLVAVDGWRILSRRRSRRNVESAVATITRARLTRALAP